MGTARYGGGPRISAKRLWQIGSNTKAFTSVMLLQLEAEHKLSIDDTLGRWLPQYSAWRRVTIKQLLNRVDPPRRVGAAAPVLVGRRRCRRGRAT